MTEPRPVAAAPAYRASAAAANKEIPLTHRCPDCLPLRPLSGMCGCRSHRSRVGSVSRNRRNTERVPGRVEKYAPSNVRLRIDLGSAQAHRSCRRLVDVRASRQIEMDDRRARPNRWNVGSDPLRNKCDSGNPHARAVRVLPEQLPAE